MSVENMNDLDEDVSQTCECGRDLSAMNAHNKKMHILGSSHGSVMRQKKNATRNLYNYFKAAHTDSSNVGSVKAVVVNDTSVSVSEEEIQEFATEEDIQVIVDDEALQRHAILCSGYSFQEWSTTPTFLSNFPSFIQQASLSWIVNSLGVFRSKKCSFLLKEGFTGICDLCANLQYNQEIKRIMNRSLHINASYTGVSDNLLTSYQLQCKLKVHRAARREVTLARLNDIRKIKIQGKALGEFKRLLVALSTSNVPRLQQLIHVALKNGSSPRSITSRLADAANQLYKVHSYSDSELDLGILAWRLGGARLVSALQAEMGLCSLSTLKRISKKVSFKPSHSSLETGNIEDNVVSMVKMVFCPRFATIDEVAVENSIDIEISTGNMTGFCYEHGMHIKKKVCCIEDAIHVKEQLDNERMHRAKECALICIGVVGGKDSSVKPIFATGSCGTGTYEHQRILLNHFLESWIKVKERYVSLIFSFLKILLIFN